MTLSQCVWTMIHRRPLVYLGLFVNVVLMTAVLFAYIGLYLHPDLEIFWDVVRPLFHANGGLLVALSFLALFYFLATLYRSRRQQLGLLLFLGMQPRQWYVWVATEIIVVGGSSVAVGVGLGVVTHMALLGGFQGMVFDGRVMLSYYQFPVSALCLTVSAFLILFAVLAGVVPFLLLRRWPLPRTWLRRGSKCKGGVSGTTYRYAWLSLLSLGTTVGICLFLPLSWLPDHKDAKFFWTAILLVTCALLSFLGMYGFYRQGMMVVAQFLRRRRGWSWQGLRLLWLRTLDHRLRDDAWSFSLLSMSFIAMLISVSMVSVIIVVGGSSRLWGPVPIGPFAVVYRLPTKEAPAEAAEIQRVQQREMAELAVRGWKLVPFSLIRFPASPMTFSFLSLQDYRVIQSFSGQRSSLFPASGDPIFLPCKLQERDPACWQRWAATQPMLRQHLGTVDAQDRGQEVQLFPVDPVLDDLHVRGGQIYGDEVGILGDRIYEQVSRLPGMERTFYAGLIWPTGERTASSLQALHQLTQGDAVRWAFRSGAVFNAALEYETLWRWGGGDAGRGRLFLVFHSGGGKLSLVPHLPRSGGSKQGVPQSFVPRFVPPASATADDGSDGDRFLFSAGVVDAVVDLCVGVRLSFSCLPSGRQRESVVFPRDRPCDRFHRVSVGTRPGFSACAALGCA